VRKELRDKSGNLIGLEANPASRADAESAAAAGLVLSRRVDQLRVSLPIADDSPLLPTRAFVPGIDDHAFLQVNNRAFEWHPDQSNWSIAQLNERMGEPWFEPEGFLLHEIDGALAGFCWTKVHPASGDEPELGEIYVIAVDPAFHGQGIGRALTVAGLRSLASRSLQIGMLHVEHDNVAAQSMYRALGFVEHDAHCWWDRDESSTS